MRTLGGTTGSVTTRSLGAMTASVEVMTSLGSKPR